ncbi:dNTP triphosphohydrolase [Ornithobacterium rhinotracheale]|uniref:dGTP triphosphohydrolase n=1 Tax=Ornithobacterium rhinotracheale TaxID=28251 RepID=UPI001FF4DFF6|nr:dNTP triphosphohydrolase [Ornithobacterium rhinotracheale]MCK0202500.1 dNTP triphosphohydrolase [Ornithobacterium rhinotracheale]
MFPKLYTTQRTGEKSNTQHAENRTDFQRDYDRIIFSSAFRKLQSKTQVFPLPGSVFVHNRLTHSLEVSSVGRSLGTLAGEIFRENIKSDATEDDLYFYKHNLAYVIASACLCHDIGNPAFGHSGEDAIAQFFKNNENSLKSYFSEEEWADFIHFEGNANAIRVLTHQQKGKSEGGLMITHTTLASIAKYPCESVASLGKKGNALHRKKFGFFQSEKETFEQIAQSCGMFKEQSNPLVYKRHPFVWLVEAADDICYNIIDFEDAHRLGIVEHSLCIELFKQIIDELGGGLETRKIENRLNKIENKEDKVSYLRAKIIGYLVSEIIKKYKIHFSKIIVGDFSTSLYDLILNKSKSLQTIQEFSIENIYNYNSVIEIESAGYNVMNELLSYFVPAILKDKKLRTGYEKNAVKLLPPSCNYDGGNAYQKVLGVLDYISSMTDDYAVELYRRIKGIEIGMIR